MTFYAHSQRFINRDSFDCRCAVTFEGVLKEHIEMFVTADLPKTLPQAAQNSNYFADVWESFARGGINDAEFLTRKATYLLDASNVAIGIMLYSYNHGKAIDNATNRWWEIEITGYPEPNTEVDTCMIMIPGIDDTGEEFLFNIRPVTPETEDALYRLYTPYIDEKTCGVYAESVEPSAVGAVGAGTRFTMVRALYVGAGLCCNLMALVTDAYGNAVVDTNGHPIHEPAGYYDMGVGSAMSDRKVQRANANMYTAQMQMKRSTGYHILNDLTNYTNLDVYISHLHDDHTSIANIAAHNAANFAAFWQTARFYIPNFPPAGQRARWNLTHVTAIQGALQRALNGNGFIVSQFQNCNVNTQINLNCQNINMQHCNRADTGTSHHPHDHGIYAVVTLESGRTVFLAGDCHYDTLSNNNPGAAILRAGYDYLVVSHHGGSYTHTTAQNKAGYIPHPNAGGNAVYSANGYAYGHPKPANVAAYANAGWTPNLLHTLQGQAYGFDLS